MKKRTRHKRIPWLAFQLMLFNQQPTIRTLAYRLIAAKARERL